MKRDCRCVVLKVGWGGVGGVAHGIASSHPFFGSPSPSPTHSLCLPPRSLRPHTLHFPIVPPSFFLPSSFLLPSFPIPSPPSSPPFFFSFPSSFSSLPRSRSTAAVQMSSSCSSLAPSAFPGTSAGHRKWWCPAHVVTKTFEGRVRDV